MIRRLRSLFRRDRTPCDGVNWEPTGRGGPGLAHLCEKRLKPRQVHRVAEVETADFGGATAMVALYCAEHCPGGCSRGCAAPTSYLGTISGYQ